MTVVKIRSKLGIFCVIKNNFWSRHDRGLIFFLKDAYDRGADAHSIGTLMINFFTLKNMFEWKKVSNLGDKILEKKCVIKISSEAISTRHFKFFVERAVILNLMHIKFCKQKINIFWDIEF